jgi:predicted SAM-dependent methyltransferase
MSLARNAVREIFNAVGRKISRKRQPVGVIADENQKHESSDMEHWQKFKMYHLGCGAIFADGFLNIDGDFDWLSKTLESGIPHAVVGRPSTHVLKHDLRSGIPAAANSLQIIYHSHFLEHLVDHEGLSFLSECHRCLAPGALMRFAVPDFKLWCTNYLSGKNDFFDWYRQAYLADDKVRFRTNASVFAGMLYNWGHKMAYDYESLSALLNDAGFTNVRRAEWGISGDISDILSVEGPSSQRRVESLVIECNKAVSGSPPAPNP